MECQHPIKIELSEKSRAKRLENVDAPIEWRYATYTYVPCGKCCSCLQRKRAEWSFRLFKEVENSESCYFITLTYDDSNLPFCNGKPCVCKSDVQKFLKRLRFQIRPFKIRYFLVSEYGPKTYRPHYHMLLFNFPNALKNKLHEFLSNSWKSGYIRVDAVTSGRINYVTSYCLDFSTLPKDLVKNFMLCSKRPGLGYSYCDSDSICNYHANTLDNFGRVSFDGKVLKFPLSRGLKDKLFTTEQNFEVNQRNNLYYFEKQKKLRHSHRGWLVKNHFLINEVTLQTPYFGSPLYEHFNELFEFNRKVRNKCKNKKDV